MERPTSKGSTQLPDYGQVFFSTANAGLVDDEVVNAGVTGGKNGPINMVVNGTTLSTGAILSETVVQCQSVGPEPNDNVSGLLAP